MSNTNWPSGRALLDPAGSWGEEVVDHHPERHRAEVDARVAAARQLGWPQVELDDLEIRGNSWRPVLANKTDGTEYRVVGFDPFLQDDPSSQPIACFLLDGAGELVFLKLRGVADAPVRQSLGGTLYSGRLEQLRGGQYQSSTKSRE